MRRMITRLAVLVALLTATACGAAGASGVQSAAPAAPPGALGFTAATLDGGTFDSAVLSGKPAVLWFWAPF